MSQFPSLKSDESRAVMPDPSDSATFANCKLDFSERAAHQGMYFMHRDLLRLRREDATFRRQGSGAVDGAVLGPWTFVLRYFGDDGSDRLLLVNLGVDLRLEPAGEPLLAPPTQSAWRMLWSSEDTAYGGSGIPPFEDEGTWTVAGFAATVLAPYRAVTS